MDMDANNVSDTVFVLVPEPAASMNFTVRVFLVVSCLTLLACIVLLLGEELTLENMFGVFFAGVLFVPVVCVVAAVQLFWVSVKFNGEVFRWIVVDLCVQGIVYLFPPNTRAAFVKLVGRVKQVWAARFMKKDKKWSSRHSLLPKCVVCIDKEACVQTGREGLGGKKHQLFYTVKFVFCHSCPSPPSICYNFAVHRVGGELTGHLCMCNGCFQTWKASNASGDFLRCIFCQYVP